MMRKMTSESWNPIWSPMLPEPMVKNAGLLQPLAAPRASSTPLPPSPPIRNPAFSRLGTISTALAFLRRPGSGLSSGLLTIFSSV